jgi:membrane-associated phospholipid phosphatase
MATATHASPPRRTRHGPLWPVWGRPFASRERLGGRLVTLLAFATLGGIGLGYFALGELSAWRGHSAFEARASWEQELPLLPWTIAIYSLHFPLFPLAILAAPRSAAGQLELLAYLQAQILLAAVAFALFLLFPVELRLVEELRAALPGEPGWIRVAFGWLYAFDRPWNSWPSLHVAQSFLNVLVLARWRAGRGQAGRVARTLLWALWVAMALSILTTRQHHLLDLVTGALAGWLVTAASLRPSLRSIDREGPEALARPSFAQARPSSSTPSSSKPSR